MKNSDNKSSFTSHFIELKSRLVKTLIFIFVIFVVSYTFAEQIYTFLVDPYANAVKDDQVSRRLIFTALHETFITYLKVAFFAAIFLGSPVLLIQIYKFIAPGLYKNEKKALLPYLISTPILFMMGGLLVYYLVMPLAIKFFLSFETMGSSSSLPIQLEAKVNEYLSLIMRLIFAFGISFQLPILLNLLARVGIVNSNYLKKTRRYVVVIIFTVAAILTPPDPITQVGLAIPLLLLYELSIITVRFTEKKNNKKDLKDA
jgi:sec-independent protein translocase protein TatC